VKKKCLLTFWGTLQGNCEVARLWSLWVKVVAIANEVSLRAGRSLRLKE